MSVLTKANAQWSTRPADERFGSLADMHASAMRIRTNAAVAQIKANALRVTADGNELLIEGKTGSRAALTNWSYGQIAERAKAPTAYLNTLPATIAADCLNAGLDRAHEDKSLQLLIDRGDRLTARSINSDAYSRIWNADITKRLVDLEAQGPWQPAPAAFDGSRGLYLGDRDMFAFLVDNNRRIFETGPGGGLSRGFMTWNSEVGDGAFGFMSFLYEYVCGNHRIWGATNIAEFRVIHIGRDQATKAFSKLAIELRKYADSSASDDEARVQAARTFEIGATKDEVLDAVFGIKSPLLTRKVVGQAYDIAVEKEDWYGNPRSAWGMAGGLTQIARDLPNANERNALDVAAAKVMEMAF
jgi:hypothetical protein